MKHGLLNRFFVFAILSLFLSAFSMSAFALVSEQQVKVLAVTSDGKGLGADLFLEVEQGNGKVWVSAQPLVGTTTQSAAQTAVELAKTFSADVKNHDYKFSIESTASVVEGPSAGAAMALAVISSFQDKKVPQNIAVTGTIDESGSVGQVGGVFEKSKEAARLGLKLFMIPKGEANQTVRENGTVKSVNLVEYGPRELKIKIVEVANIDEVLNYAFSDIEAIDVSQIIAQSEVPEFVPQKIDYAPHLQPMKDLVTNYIEETKVVISEAKTAVSTTLINDPELLSTLLEIINISDGLMRDADNLNTQNYLYSAANFVFLARVDALLVKDVSNNPSLLSMTSSTLDLKLNELKTEVASLEESLEGKVPADALEWHVSAQQRLAYAKLNIDKLSNTQTIVIGEEGPNYDVALQRLTEFEFAVAWVDVAKDFKAIADSGTSFVELDSQFKPLSEKLISEAENSIEVLSADMVPEDISRRLDAAKFEHSKDWFVAAAVDAATAKALSESEKTVADKSLAQLEEILEQKITSLESKISSSEHKYSWPVLYLDHSKYFLEASKYYVESGSTSRAINALRSGISLISLAEQIFDPLQEVYGGLESIPAGNGSGRIFFPSTQNNSPNGQARAPVLISDIMPSWPIVLFAVGLILLGFLFLFFTFRALADGSKTAFGAQKNELDSLKKMKIQADTALLKGVISSEKHSELVKNYNDEMHSLAKLRQAHAAQLMEIEEFRQSLSSMDKKLRDLKLSFKKGALLEEDFSAHKEKLAMEIDLLMQKHLPSPKQEDLFVAMQKPKQKPKAAKKKNTKKTKQKKKIQALAEEQEEN